MTDKEKIIKLEEELALVKKELKNFSYLISHDLKQPVRGMKNYVNFTLEDFGNDLNEEVVDNLNNVLKQGDRFDILMEGVLELSRLNTSVKENINLNFNEIIDSVVKKLSLDTSFECDISGRAEHIGDLVLVSTLFEKIIHNSILYNLELDKKVSISIVESTEEISIIIKDNGIGIEQKHSEGIFKIFSRLNGQTEFGSRSGTGLTVGLKIMELHNGNIKLNPSTGGSEIELTFVKL